MSEPIPSPRKPGTTWRRGLRLLGVAALGAATSVAAVVAVLYRVYAPPEIVHFAQSSKVLLAFEPDGTLIQDFGAIPTGQDWGVVLVRIPTNVVRNALDQALICTSWTRRFVPLEATYEPTGRRIDRVRGQRRWEYRLVEVETF